ILRQPFCSVMRRFMRTCSARIATARFRWKQTDLHSTFTHSRIATFMSKRRHEDTKNTKDLMAPLRISTPLPDDLEDLGEGTIGACIAVHAELGPGLLEGIYSKAIAAELTALGIGFDAERSLPVTYRGTVIGHHRLDLLVEGQLVLEVKTVERLLPVHVAQ